MINKITNQWMATLMSVVTIMFAHETYSLIVRTDLIDLQVIFGFFTFIFGYVSYVLWTQKETDGKKKP